jgi:predicted regulator of Ras-like GTPase activity (Roadblock/LC7/MglB family)
MIRSTQVPSVLGRICGDGIRSVALVTGEGELLGTSCRQMADQATLLTEIASDYVRLAAELRERTFTFLCLELEQGTVGVASAGPDFVVAVCDKETPLGLLKGRLMACALHVQEAMAPMTEAA